MTWSDAYIGLPFEDGGNGPERYDCWGLTRKVMREVFDTELLDHQYSLEGRERDAVVEDNRLLYHRVNEAADGVLVLYYLSGRRPHIGVCVGNTHVLHMMRGSTGSVLLPLTSPMVRNGFDGFYLPN